MTDARDAAGRAIRAEADRYPDLLPLAIDTDGLDHREGALAHAIASAVVRRWITLAWVIEAVGGRPMSQLEPGVRAALLCGAAQLLLLDRIPRHAAINEQVAWTKRRVRARAGGLVNAVLRRVAELRDPDAERRDRWTARRDELPLPDGTAVPLTADVMPEDPRQLAAVAASTPRRLIERWAERRGWDDAELIALHGLIEPPTVLNTVHARDRDRLPLPPHRRPGAHLVPPGMGIADALEAAPGTWVQDAGSAAALRVAADLEPRLAIDLCAGRGTKTRQMLSMFPAAEVIAAEVEPGRLADLRRLAESEPRLRVFDASELADRFSGRADLVLADVPCSNTGVLARRPEARYRVGRAQFRRLAETQRSIAESGAGLLADGGRLVYSTCSIEVEENTAVRSWIERSLGLTLECERGADPEGLPGDPPAVYADGGYAAMLRRGLNDA